jgi:hypothetical protein
MRRSSDRPALHEGFRERDDPIRTQQLFLAESGNEPALCEEMAIAAPGRPILADKIAAAIQ